MYFGKFALIVYIFSAITMAVALLILNTTGVNLFENTTVSYSALDTLITSHNVTASANPNFIFGDYLAGAQAVGTIIFQGISGGIVGDVLNSIPFVALDPAIGILIQILVTFCGAMLIINLLSGRDL